MLKQHDYTPIYRRIMQGIIDDIANGVFEAGDMIPSQFEYAEKYQVSRVTVREAINKLVSRGLLQTIRGKGTFVAKPTGASSGYNRTAGFSYSIDNIRHSPKEQGVFSKVIFLGEVEADKHIGKKLEMAPGGKVVKIVRVRYISSMPIAMETSYINRQFVSNVDFSKENLETGSLYQVLAEKAGIRYKYTDETSILPNTLALMMSR
ncbi:MAG: GntR family transcriptional regulator [Angelakisella sp.]